MNPNTLSTEQAKEFAEIYLQYLRMAAFETGYNLKKLLYCYHRFYNKQYMVQLMQYWLVCLAVELSFTRRGLALSPPLDGETSTRIHAATEELVRFLSMELGLFEGKQQMLMERLIDRTRQDYLTHDGVQGYLQSDEGEELGAAISKWTNAEMADADRLVAKGDEHGRGECPYVEEYIHNKTLYRGIQTVVDVMDPIISWVKFHIRLGNTSGRMPGIFVSYRREDVAMTGRLYDRLCSHFGVGSVFLDLDAIPLGADFRTHIRSAVTKSDALLAVIGEHWLASDNGEPRISNPDDFVRIEIETALQEDVLVIPVLIEGASMPTENQLPSTLSELPYRNAIEISSGTYFQDHVGRLINGLERYIGGPGEDNAA